MIHNNTLNFFQCGLPSLQECKELAESAHAGGEIFPAVKYYLLSPEPEKALPIGITYVKGECLRDRENVSVFNFIFYHSAISRTFILQTMHTYCSRLHTYILSNSILKVD